MFEVKITSDNTNETSRSTRGRVEEEYPAGKGGRLSAN